MGDYSERLSSNAAIVWAVAPAQYGWAAGASGVPICLKGYDHCTVIIPTGAGAFGAIPNPERVTLTQDVSVTPTAAVKALAFTSYSTNEAATGSSVLIDIACASAFQLLAPNAIYAIEVDSDSLDADGRFTSMRLEISDAQKFEMYSAYYVLTQTRHGGPSNLMWNATID